MNPPELLSFSAGRGPWFCRKTLTFTSPRCRSPLFIVRHPYIFERGSLTIRNRRYSYTPFQRDDVPDVCDPMRNWGVIEKRVDAPQPSGFRQAGRCDRFWGILLVQGMALCFQAGGWFEVLCRMKKASSPRFRSFASFPFFPSRRPRVTQKTTGAAQGEKSSA